jgi:putative ABC transport system permease protein
MRLLRAWFLRLAELFHRERRDRELAEELESHLQMHIEDNLRSGMSPKEARRNALIKLGGVEQTKESYRDRRGFPVVETLLQDIRFTLRILLKTPVITLVALLSLALGIGANTAIFSLIDTVMLRLLPVQNPEELVQVLRQSPLYANGPVPSFTNPLWEQLREQQDVFSGTFAWSAEDFDLADGGEAQFVRGLYASGEFFSTLGVHPIAGRIFTAADDRRGCAGVAVLGYGFWQQHYAGAETAIGSLLRVNGHSFRVIGVAPPRFFGMEVGDRFDVALPVCAEALMRGKNSFLDLRDTWWLHIAGRLKPGLTRDQASARLEILAPQIYGAVVPSRWPAAAQQSFRKLTLATRPAATGRSDPSGRRARYVRPLEVLMAIVGIVLLITCANLASLMLARAAARQKEIAVRLSLGASRARLIRQLLTESLVLSAAGALLGVLFARWGSALLVRFVSTTQNKVFLDLSLDGRILGFTAAMAILTGLLFGFLPAIRATRVSLSSAMKGGEAGEIKSRSHFGSGHWIVASQVALALLLLAGTGLFVRTFRNLVTLDPGFDPNNILLARVNLHNSNLPEGARASFYAELLDRLKSIPGVASVSQCWFTPISGNEWNENILVDGYQPAPDEYPLVWFNWLAPGYFVTLDTPLLEGRDFDNRDTATSSRVAIVNQTMARRFYPHADPIGKYFRISDSYIASAQPIQIVGLVRDSKFGTLREDFLPFAYVPVTQVASPSEESSFEIRTAASPASVVPAVRDVIGQADKSASLEFRTLAGQVDDSLAQERLLAKLSAFFGGLALLLTAIGLYGVMAYLVTRRTHEIGIRMALGAAPGSILRLVMRDVAILLAVGIGAGLLVAYWATRLVQSFLFGLTVRDTATLAFAVFAIVAVALAASYLPARRAMRVDPMVALRYE